MPYGTIPCHTILCFALLQDPQNPSMGLAFPEFGSQALPLLRALAERSSLNVCFLLVGFGKRFRVRGLGGSGDGVCWFESFQDSCKARAICQDVDVCLYQAVRVRACLCRSVCRLADLPFALLSDTPTLSLHCRSPGSPHPSLRAKTLGAIPASCATEPV